MTCSSTSAPISSAGCGSPSMTKSSHSPDGMFPPSGPDPCVPCIPSSVPCPCPPSTSRSSSEEGSGSSSSSASESASVAESPPAPSSGASLSSSSSFFPPRAEEIVSGGLRSSSS
eukprot:30986-Pelagococcus_subviridis.AAC.11